MTDFPTALRSGRVILMDGAMGTEFVRRGLPLDSCFETLNLARPSLVQKVHRDYVQAGAQVLLTNTFQLFSGGLDLHDHELSTTGTAAIRLAHARFERSVLLALGPNLGGDPEQAIGAAVSLGAAENVDGLLLETC